jgi:DNA-binding XRE family transcriptional regulator
MAGTALGEDAGPISRRDTPDCLVATSSKQCHPRVFVACMLQYMEWMLGGYRREEVEGSMPASKRSGREPERGRRIAEARRSAGISQEQLAGRIGVARSTIARIETGVTTPTLDVALALAAELRIPAEQLAAKNRTTSAKHDGGGH